VLAGSPLPLLPVEAGLGPVPKGGTSA
jgi:hypothetical protein